MLQDFDDDEPAGVEELLQLVYVLSSGDILKAQDIKKSFTLYDALKWLMIGRELNVDEK